MKYIYNRVIEAFEDKKEWFTAEGLTPPKYIDFYYGQPDEPEAYEFSLPALFMDYSITSWKKKGNIYVGSVNLQFHAIPEVEPGTNHKNRRKEQGLQVMKWYELCRQVLDTVTGQCFTRLTRGPETPAFTPDFKYHIIGFDCEMDDVPGTEINRYIEGKIEGINIAGEIKTKFSL